MVEMELRVLILDNSPREQTWHTLAPWFPRPRILGTGKCRQEACGGGNHPRLIPQSPGKLGKEGRAEGRGGGTRTYPAAHRQLQKGEWTEEGAHADLTRVLWRRTVSGEGLTFPSS